MYKNIKYFRLNETQFEYQRGTLSKRDGNLTRHFYWSRDQCHGRATLEQFHGIYFLMKSTHMVVRVVIITVSKLCVTRKVFSTELMFRKIYLHECNINII